jgi:hypothetical protein
MYFTYHSENSIDWITLFSELWTFTNSTSSFGKFSVGTPSLENIYTRIMEEDNQNNS